MLTNFTYRILDLSIAFAQQIFCLLAGFTQNFLAILLNFADVVFVFFDGFLHLFLALMNGLALVFPVTLVANDVLQIFVTLHISRTDDLGRVANHLFGKSYLTRDLDGKTATRLSDLQLKERAHLLSVVQHGTIDNTVVVFCKVFQILIVGRYNAIGSFLTELSQNRFGNRTADLRFGAGPELIDQQQRAVISLPHHILHIQQMR